MRHGNTPWKRRGGISVVELMAAVTLMGIILSLGILGVRAFRARGGVVNGVRCVTAAFQAARYRAIGLNRRQRLRQAGDDRLELQEVHDNDWETIQRFATPQGVRLEMNARPVFYPEGHVVPLCSVIVTTEHYSRKVSISLAGRIHVITLP